MCMKRTMRRMIMTLLVVVVVAATQAWAAHPFRGSAKWSVILCNFSDSPAPTRDANFYRQMVVNSGTGGMADYWQAVSGGVMDVEGSVVMGWYTEPHTREQALQRSQSNRVQKYQDCLDTARTSTTNPYTPPADHLVAVVTNPGIDLFGMNGVGAFLPVDFDLGGILHEGGHGVSFNHSFSDDPTYQNASWAAIGEYDDPWDVMSYANVFSRPTTQFGSGGPGLNAFHVDRMGWLGRDSVMRFGSDGIRTKTVTLKALDPSISNGTQLIRIPFDPSDLFRYYTVEFRRKQGWDNGIPGDIVLIHESRRLADGSYVSYLLRERAPARNPVSSLQANGISIRVDRIESANGQAIVTISSEMVDRCVLGFVWREAGPQDHVCVSGQVRDATRQDNAQAAARRNPAGGPFGPDTCLQGFVWREAFPGDHVCVTGDVRTRTRDENAAAASRQNPARLAFGPNTCKQGYVWREADSRDYVCVTGNIREQTRQDNAQAAARRNPAGGPFGPDTCLQGFVWREAFRGDHVCVAPPTRSQARADNREAANRVEKP